MAQRWRVRVGSKVRYRNADGRVFHAIVTVVTSQTIVDLRVGGAASSTDITAVSRLTARGAGAPFAAGWYRSAKELT